MSVIHRYVNILATSTYLDQSLQDINVSVLLSNPVSMFKKMLCAHKCVYIYIHMYMSSGQNHILNLMPCTN